MLKNMKLKEGVQLKDIVLPDNCELEIILTSEQEIEKECVFITFKHTRFIDTEFKYVWLDFKKRNVDTKNLTEELWDTRFKFLEEYIEDGTPTYESVADFIEKNNAYDGEIDILESLVKNDYIEERTFTYYVNQSGDEIGDENDTESVIENVLDNLSKEEIEELFEVVILGE